VKPGGRVLVLDMVFGGNVDFRTHAVVKGSGLRRSW
jgi:hypothetical protein